MCNAKITLAPIEYLYHGRNMYSTQLKMTFYSSKSESQWNQYASERLFSWSWVVFVISMRSLASSPMWCIILNTPILLEKANVRLLLLLCQVISVNMIQHHVQFSSWSLLVYLICSRQLSSSQALTSSIKHLLGDKKRKQLSYKQK